MFFLAPLGDLTRFLSSNIKNEVYLITKDVCIKSNGLLLAARSAKIEQILEESEKIPAVQFSDNMAGLEDCLDLVYGGSVDIREDNFKSIYKFGKLFEISKMMKGVLAWIANDVTYENFWSVYLDLKSLHDNISDFVNIITGYLSAADDNFMELTTELCCSQDKNTITAVVELLSRIDDIRVLYVMENIIDTATEINETLANTTSSKHANHYLQEVVCSTVIYIENYLKSGSGNEFDRLSCKQTLQKAASVCTDVEVLRTITRISFGKSIQFCSCWNFTALSIKDLNWERVKQLTSRTTPYEAIKYFTENAGAGIHPCVVVGIVLKWWRVRTDREHVNMSFMTPLITTIQNVSSQWYNSVYWDERYKSLIKTLNIPKPTAERYMYYSSRACNNNITLTATAATMHVSWRIVSEKEMVHQHNLRTCGALRAWRDIDKVYQHSDTMLLYFLLMEILYITGTLEHMVLRMISMYLLLLTLKKRYVIVLIMHGVFFYILYLYLTLYNNIKA